MVFINEGERIIILSN